MTLNWLSTIRYEIRALFSRHQVERELDEELRGHVQMQADQNKHGGMEPAEARFAAFRNFGGVDQAKEQCRDTRGLLSLDAVWQDLRFAMRLLVKHRGFTVVAVLTLGIAIGLNSTIFTIVNAYFLRGLPVPNPDQITYVASRKKGEQRGRASYPDFEDWRSGNKTFQDLGAIAFGSVNLSDDGLIPQQYNSARITANTFAVLRQKPLLGRDFTPEDAKQGTASVAIIGYDVWQNRYAGDQHIVGRSIHINGVSTTVIAVMPRGMKFPYFQEVWLPLIPNSQMQKRDARNLMVFARLADGMTVARAQSDMDVVAHQLESEYPATNRDFGVEVNSFVKMFTNDQTRMLFIALLGAVSFLLLIACTNVANLILSRSLIRGAEIATRAALGASRLRILRQLLIESLVLGGLGGLAGFFLSILGVRLFLACIPGDFSRGMPYWADNFSMDHRVFAYVTLISLLVGIFFGLAPALHVSRFELSRAMKLGTVRATSAYARILPGALVVGEITLALVLLNGAGLMVRTFLNVSSKTADLEQKNVLTMRFNLMEQKYPQLNDRLSFHDNLHTKLASIPGVDSVAFASALPVERAPAWRVDLSDSTAYPEGSERLATGMFISPAYFKVLGRSILQGRQFEAEDGRSRNLVAVVNDQFAKKYWNDSAIGKRLRVVGDVETQWLTVVGVAPNIKQNDPDDEEVLPIVYIPYPQQVFRNTAVLLRTSIAPRSVITAVRTQFQKLDSELPVFAIISLADDVALERSTFSIFGFIFAIFGLVALVIASVGVYAVLAFSVSRQSREIGIRMALGASPTDILRRVVKTGVGFAITGLFLGLIGSIIVTRVMNSILVGISATDPTTFAAMSLLLVSVAALACYLPARRAARLDPILALRTE
jgi:putative ABC transport system permease protein